MFNEYKWKDLEDGAHYRKVLDNNHVFWFLAGLNVKFDEVRGRIIGRQPLPPINEVIAEVRREESRRMVMLGRKVVGSSVKTSALIIQDASANKVSFQKHENKLKLWCDHCNRPHHTRETCWKLHGKPTNWKPKDKRQTTSPTAYVAEQNFFSKEQFDQLLKLIKSSPGTSSLTPSGSLAQSVCEF
ncbi:hypothetical protein ACOSQ4_009976 [Xanthoceras sorbifolium]